MGKSKFVHELDSYLVDFQGEAAMSVEIDVCDREIFGSPLEEKKQGNVFLTGPVGIWTQPDGLFGKLYI